MTTDREHDFALVLTGFSDLTDEVENALFEAGCDDATLSIRSGVPYLTFSRTAPSLKDAILGAIQAVRGAGIGADVVRVDDCDLVTQADIGRRIGRSRQLVHQYMTGLRGPGGFPAPVCYLAEKAPLWYWCEVAYWLRQNGMIREEDLQDAAQVAVINVALEVLRQQRLVPELMEEVVQALGVQFTTPARPREPGTATERRKVVS